MLRTTPTIGNTSSMTGRTIEEMMMSEFEKDKFVEIMKEIAVQLSTD